MEGGGRYTRVGGEWVRSVVYTLLNIDVDVS